MIEKFRVPKGMIHDLGWFIFAESLRVCCIRPTADDEEPSAENKEL